MTKTGFVTNTFYFKSANIDLDEIILQAIQIDDRDKYVSLFLENGFDLKQFLTRKRLLDLYYRVSFYFNKL
jgi:hypothetical protein